MRIYLPLALSDLFEPQLYSSCAWEGTSDFCRLWGVDPLDSEQAEDIAMTMAAMSCLEGSGEGYQGRIVAALDADPQELSEEITPGVFEVKTRFDWQRLVSLHLDSQENLELCTQLRSQMPRQRAAAWCRGNFGDAGASDPTAASPVLELWEELAGEPLSWFDASELDYLRHSLGKS